MSSLTSDLASYFTQINKYEGLFGGYSDGPEHGRKLRGSSCRGEECSLDDLNEAIQLYRQSPRRKPKLYWNSSR